MNLDFKEVDKGELSRTYVFPDGEVLIKNVARVAVRPSGSHRVETTNGEKYIVAAGWLAIKVEADAWSF
jgi:hypothetical protein